MSTLNLGILAHVDAGKTSLTERLLYAAGVIDEIGSVDDGSTQTDSLALERRRGITIKSAVVSFAVGDTTVNLIDTPGHPDFIAEVERVLSVLDGAVLVISAVEGVQAQTRVLMRALQRLRIPTLLFINKIDRRGAREAELLRAIAERLTPAIIPMGSASGLGTPDASFVPHRDRTGLEVLAEHDEELLSAYVADESGITAGRARAELVAQTGRALVHPVFFGSAITGAGVAELMAGVRELLPAAGADATAPASGTVFKVERGAAGERVGIVRMFAGTLRVRDRLQLDRGEPGKVTGIGVFADGTLDRRDQVTAGQIAKVWGLGDVRIGDRLGEAAPVSRHFAPPTLETVVSSVRAADRGALHAALTQLADQDPLINLRQDELRQELSVSLYGEVQKEVIQATLADEFGLMVTFRETTTICIERLDGVGAAVEFIAKGPNPFLATIGLRVEPAPVGTGVRYRLEVELGSMPLAFMTAVEETVRETLGQGLHGWQVPDCEVVMTHSGYWARQSHAHGTFDKSMSSTGGDFRLLTPLVLMDALRAAGTTVCEPMHRFRLEIPSGIFGSMLPALVRLGAIPQTSSAAGTTSIVEGELPADRVHGLELQLPGLTSGEGVLETVFDHYRPVVGVPPERSRTDHNPLNRREYLLHVVRRV
ncbi:ribosomal protection tetracycline resistance protein [Allocatelliglobosispora scoriae]|uniref:Ribosomal protection tetracycline resistance protein n=1 Tax=Allocatelliglobosispora scoriae TaxID=643052 RepID=A0A841BPV3_9ACTN|nr:TetM/TetW/TetO/TetS family tetracycline resistance ribosomal protection protein [Allocatelliglobosispora scoriae]MBB5868850.1 ribosomal protection tetracycline resistance protein [Allocatelliglobosispora scoriae]